MDVPFWRRIDPRIVVAAVGVLVAGGILLTDDKDPLVFALPVLVATTVLVVVITLAGGSGGDARTLEQAAPGLGLTYEGMRPVPPVTALLAGAGPTGPVARGELVPGGPDVRLTRHAGRLVAITDAPGSHLDEGARRLLAEHPLRPDAEIEQRLLVVAVDGDAPPAELLDLARELHARLEVLAFSG